MKNKNVLCIFKYVIFINIYILIVYIVFEFKCVYLFYFLIISDIKV